ncbi:MAG: thioredoxin family protein [Candidatus Accumulibacter sp.]|uniref:thioredoxin family protein n=1 Tax=Accumulibacter sp. TaxID=2053492 RepID=UPI001A4537A0|nr:thioredoxin family protein [Accumulibacter sp.]MBL8394240.1 thioredoxin family protein [Accumulibacter sp.]
MGLDKAYAANEPSRAEIDACEGALLLEFGAPWCGHCVAAEKLLETALRTHPGVHHIRVEDGRGRRLGRSFAVKLWPTLIFLRQGKEVLRLVRPSGAGDIERALAQLVTTADQPCARHTA